MWNVVARLISRLLVVCAAGVLVITLVTNLAGQAEATIAKPYVIAGYKNGPVGLPLSLSEVARLPLPAGKWVVSVKGYFNSTFYSEMTCRLDVGGSWDYSKVYLGSYMFGTMALSAATSLGSPGNAIVKCSSSQSQAELNWIKITAIKAGTLNIVQMQ